VIPKGVYKRTPEMLANYSAAKKRYYQQNPAAKEVSRERARRAWQDPEYRAKHSGDNNASRRPEVRAKISAGKKGKPPTEKQLAQYVAYRIAYAGIPLSPERCAAISRGMTGKKRGPHSSSHRAALIVAQNRPEVRAKRSASLSGPNSGAWKGGITGERDRAESCLEYSDWRKAVFARDDYTCQVCGKRGGHLEAHHIVWWSQCRTLFYDVSNGLTACKMPCHMKGLHAPSMRLAG